MEELTRIYLKRAEMNQPEDLWSARNHSEVTTNHNNRITSWNDAAERMYGWLCDEAEGKNLDELLGAKYVESTFEQAFEALHAHGRLELELVHTTREGRKLQVLDRVTLLRDGSGRAAGMKHIFLNAAGRGPDGELEEPADYLEQTPADSDTWSYDVPDDMRWHASLAMHPEDRASVEETVKAAMESGQPGFQVQCRMPDGYGEYAWALTQGRIAYSFGRPVRITGVTVDISSIKALEFDLRQQVGALEQQTLELTDKSRLMTEFFTNISHEFKTPLSIILVDLQLMEYRLKEADGSLGEKLGRTVSVMRQNALRLLRLIGNLLDVTKIEAGFMKTRLMNLDIVELVSGLTESVRSYAESAGIEVSFHSKANRRELPMDGEKLERIMLNLLSNAVKHTPPGGHIEVRLTGNADRVRIAVRDDGEGIAEEKKDFIFDRFHQDSTTLARASEGCGIGLALTKSLVELLQGRIWFTSEVGRGSEFFVELPVLQMDWQAVAPEIEGMTRDRKVEMELSSLLKFEKQNKPGARTTAG